MATRSTKKRPTLKSRRLVLRPFKLSDAKRVQLLVGDRDVAKTTLAIDHPYDTSMAKSWIATHPEALRKGEQLLFAITLKSSGELIGAIGLVFKPNHDAASLGYWVGKSYWGRGYCTEAAGAVLRYAFSELRLNRVHAEHFSHNRPRDASCGRLVCSTKATCAST